jgi:hypothetical protein
LCSIPSKWAAPPAWDNVPEEFQTELAALDRLEDEALWKIAQAHKSNSEMTRYEALLQKNQDHTLSDTERTELTTLRVEGDRSILRKAQAAAILRWRGHTVIHS